MGLSGSQTAYKQNRAGIARADSTRAGYYFVNHIVTIGGTNRSAYVMFGTLRVTLNRNDEPDDASFTIRANPGFTPTAGQEVKVCLGTASNPIFAGQIGQMRHPRVLGEPYPFYDVSCQDWTRLFNRRLIYKDFSGLSATEIAQTIVRDYTSGFTAEAIESGLATIDEFICTHETPMAALVRLANLVGGGVYVDARKIVHFWDSNGPSSAYAPTPPVQLTTSLSTLKQFTPEFDFSQIRTRVSVEGKTAPVVWTIPVGADLVTYGIPLGINWYWLNTSSDPTNNYIRIGEVVCTYDHVDPLYVSKMAYLDGDMLAGDSGFSVLGIADSPPITVPGWFTDGKDPPNYWYAEGPLAPYGPPAGTFVAGVPTSGYGSIPVNMPSGTIIHQAPSLVDVTPDAAIAIEIPRGADIVVMARVDDAAAQATVAALEGGDGIHEHIVKDDRLSWIGCYVRAQAELDLFASSLVRASWDTYDMTAMPGAEQSINITGTDTVSATLLIDSVTLTFPIPHHPPLRRCEGSTVKLATILDLIRG